MKYGMTWSIAKGSIIQDRDKETGPTVTPAGDEIDTGSHATYLEVKATHNVISVECTIERIENGRRQVQVVRKVGLHNGQFK